MIDPFLMTLIIAVITGVIIVVVMALVWLVLAHLKLKRDYQVLADIVQSHNNDRDIDDLCAALLTADERITATEEQLSILCEKIAAYQHNEPSTHPYSQVIQKVHSGASVSELMQNSGLSQDEAALLIRLHGSKTQL